jgi:ABC-type multidrug transport system permease subunit
MPPRAFVGNTFVPMQGLPGWLQAVTNWNPVSATVQAIRQLFGNTGAMQATAWPMQHAAWVSLGWSLVILAIFAPLCVRRYRTMATK